MKQLNLFLELTRLKRPIGYMLLFWPCAWGLTAAYDFEQNLEKYFFFFFLFFLGAVLMRSAGCIINDIADKDFDKKVTRTKNRPIASGEVSVKVGFLYAAVLCVLAFLVLINFNQFTIILALGSMPLAFTYPLMKRFTYWPQLFLGVTFNYGLVLGWTSIHNEINLIPLILYIGAIFWTLGYDTIYGYQDIKDDEIIGLKSTSIKFKNNSKKFLFFCYTLFFISMVLAGYEMELNYFYYTFLLLIFYQLFIFQIQRINFKDPSSCLKIFKSNNLLGLLVFINIIMGKI